MTRFISRIFDCSVRLFCLMLLISPLVLASCASSSVQQVPTVFVPQKQAEFVQPGKASELVWAKGKFTEGPTIDSEGAVLFTDIPMNRIMRFDPRTGETKVWHENSGSANGLQITADGKLLVCEGADGGARRVSLTDKNGKLTVVADRINGKRFNSPNDVDVAPNGDIYFTDPRYTGDEPRELDYEGVFVVRDGKVRVARSDIQRPNGILISRDGKNAFCADNNNRPNGNVTLEKFDINTKGEFVNKRTLFSFKTGQRGFDGMTFDAKGNIYATAGLGKDAGIYIFSPQGVHLAFIKVPDCPTNCTFAGPKNPNTLYYTAQVLSETPGATPKSDTDTKVFGLYRIELKK